MDANIPGPIFDASLLRQYHDALHAQACIDRQVAEDRAKEEARARENGTEEELEERNRARAAVRKRLVDFVVPISIGG